MLRVIAHKSAAAAGKYYTEGLKHEDYYTEKQEIVGLWYGKGAARLGMSGGVEQAAFVALVENRNPSTGKRLTARTNVDRRVGYDLNFHAPKSLSVLHALTGDRDIMKAFRSAVADTMSEIEGQAATRVRRGRSDTERITGNLMWAEFVHLTARPVGGVPDPHLHAHCFAMNATFDDKEGRWKAASWAGIKKDAPYYEAAFHSRLANNLQELGYGITKTSRGWEVAGISRSIIDRFSRRTQEIDKLAEAKGITDPKKKGLLGASTREGKRRGSSYDNLRNEWAGRLSSDEKATIAKIARRKAGSNSFKNVSVAHAANEALEKVFARDSVVEVNKIAKETLRFGLGSVTPEMAWGELSRRKLIVREIGGQFMCTTVDVLAEEIALIDFVRTGRGMFAPFKNGSPQVSKGLSGEQRAAVLHLLKSNDQVMIVRGGAGVGKTTLMREAVKQIEETGVKVFAFAPSAEASRGTMREAGFENAETVAHLLSNPSLQRKTRGQVIWIDEAGLLGIREMSRITELAGSDTKIILTGDVAQHRPVSRGDTLSLIQRYSGLKVAHVSQIRRQEIEEYRNAVDALSKGDLKSGFKRLDELGAIVEITDDAQRHRLLAGEFVEMSRSGTIPLVVSPTHREGERVTEAIRTARRDAGQLGQERLFDRLWHLDWTEPDRRLAENYRSGLSVQFNQNVGGIVRGSLFNVLESEGDGKVWMADRAGRKQQLPLNEARHFDVFEKKKVSFAPGDRLRITRNGKSDDGRRLNNGSLFTVKNFDRKGRIVLNTGAALSPDHGHFALGYCQTTYSAQGKTARDVLVAQSSDSFLASSREGFYVTVSRGQKSVRIFTDDRKALQEAVGNSSLRLSGVEFAGFSKAQISPSMTDEKGDPPRWQDKLGSGKKPNEWRNYIKSRLGKDGAAQHVKNVIDEGQAKTEDQSFQNFVKMRQEAAKVGGRGRSKGGPPRKDLPIGGLNNKGDVAAPVKDTTAAKVGVPKIEAKPTKPAGGARFKRLKSIYAASGNHFKKIAGRLKGPKKTEVPTNSKPAIGKEKPSKPKKNPAMPKHSTPKVSAKKRFKQLTQKKKLKLPPPPRPKPKK